MSATSGVPAAVRPAAGSADIGTGVVIAALVFLVFAGVAVSVDFPRAAFGFKSDEATYYMMGHSLARDGDLEYRREDLSRVWREFASGPAGIFLKKGRDLDVALTSRPPFLEVAASPDPEADRLFYGKSYAYPLLAAPFVALAGTNGFLVFHALLLGLSVLAAYLFVGARSPTTVAALLGSAYVLATVVPGYYAWITPELFNFVLVLLGYFCWLYKSVAPATLPRGLRWLRGPASDVAAVVLLALATFSKPSNVLVIGPVVAWMAWRRQRSRAMATAVAFGALVGALFAGNVAISGDWNFQGGERNTYYTDFPFLDADSGFDVGMDRATNRVLTDVIFDWTPAPGSTFGYVFPTVLSHNLMYFFVGRHSGLVAYFFPAVFALVCFLWPWARREGWQWLVLAAGLAEILLLVVWIPYNYFGGAGVLGNRYFMNSYGLFLFLLPPLASPGLALLPWAVGALFTAQITLNPFYYSFRPHEAMKHGPLRWLPVELTLVNDLPINTNVERVRVLFGNDPRFQIYFLDDNAYARDGNGFWVRGNARSDMLLKTPEPVRRLKLTVTNGPVPASVTVRAAGQRIVRQLTRGEITTIEVRLNPGFPYQGTRVWPVSVDVDGGFVPLFDAPGDLDHRYLGVFLTPELLP